MTIMFETIISIVFSISLATHQSSSILHYHSVAGRKKLPGEEKPKRATPLFLIPVTQRWWGGGGREKNRSILTCPHFLCRSVCRGKQTWPPDFFLLFPSPGSDKKRAFLMRCLRFAASFFAYQQERECCVQSLQNIPKKLLGMSIIRAPFCFFL